MTYPSGKQVTYTFDAGGRISASSVTAGTTAQIVSGITYHPFGGLTGFTFGAGGQAYSRTYNFDGRVTSYKLGTTVYNVTYDDGGNITRISDPANTPQDKVFTYDKADRLLSLSTSPTTLNQSFTYDKVGNRLTRVLNGTTSTYSMAAASNRLSAVAGVSRTYDLAGNQIGNGTATFTYDDRGRMSGAVTPLGTISFGVNALGQRVRKTVGTVTTYFAYDLQGRLIGEYDGTGQPVQEVSWIGDTPVATIRPNGTSFDVFFVWSDHLNTPRLVTNAAGQTRWDWPNVDPFGANLPNENPSPLGAFSFGMRFPGQYFDTETQTHYNYFRDFDPGIGRYVQSDPIGLRGGLNTYAYVVGNPLTKIDPGGLDVWAMGEGGFTGHAIGVGFGGSGGIARNLSTGETCPYIMVCPRIGLGLQLSVGGKVGGQGGPKCGKDLSGWNIQAAGDAVSPGGGAGFNVGVGERSLTGAGIGVGPGWGAGASLALEFCWMQVAPGACKNTPCECSGGAK